MRRSMLLVVFLALAAAFALGLRADGVASADSARVAVEDAKAESKFPDGILFRLKVSNPADVKTVTVRFSIVGGKVPRYDYLPVPDASTGVSEVIVRTGSDRYIPPGVLMEYYFEVEDTAGNLVKSQPKRFIFDDPRFTWEEIKQGDVTIRYYGPIRRRAETVLEAVNSTVDRIGKKLFGLTEVSPVRLTLYNNWRDMVTALPPTSRTQRGELITEGTTFSNFGIILLLADDAQVRGLASHEMVHFLVSDAMGGLSQALPVWMNEGLAEYGNIEPGQVYEQYLSIAIVRGILKPLTSLTQMPGKSEDVIVVYGLGRSVMEYLIEREPNGAEKLRKVLRLLRDGQGMDTALSQAYGFDRFGLDQRWRKTIGAPLLPEDVSKAELPKAQTVTAAPLPFPQATTSQQQTPSTKEAASAEGAKASDKPRRAGGGACSRSEGTAADVGMWLGLAGALAFVAVRRRWRG